MNYPKHNRQLMWLNNMFNNLRHAIVENLGDFYNPKGPMHYYDERELVKLVRDARNVINCASLAAAASGKPIEQMEKEYDEYMQLRDEKIKADADDARAAEREESEE